MKNPYHSQFKPTFPFMATDWRWCWKPKRLKVQLPTFTTGFVLPSIKIVYYQHLLVSFEELLSLGLSDHFALVVGCINNNWLKNNENWNKKESVYNFWCGHFSAFETEKNACEKKKSFKDDKPLRAQNMLKKIKKNKKILVHAKKKNEIRQ